MLAPDPVKRSLNPYPYCDNDPVNYNDPTGEIPTILAGGLLGGLFGGASGFLGSTISQVTSGEEFNWRKALGAGANGAVVGAARGALIGSGAGIPAAFATDFLAGASGNALEQWIIKERADRIDIGESLVSGISNAFGQMLYGTGQLKGLGDAFIRGARSGAAVSGLENIAGALGLTGRDPRRMCGSPDPFDLESGLGGSRGYHGGAGHSRIGNGGGFSLGSFVKDTLTGAVAGGLGSAGFYGAGKAVEALRGSVVGRRNVSERDIHTGVGYDAGDSPVRIDGKWTESDMKQALLGHSPRGLGSPDIHHGGQMPGGALHEIVPKEHRNNYVLHQNLYNQGVTSEMRMKDRQLHWWYRAREQGADQLLPDWIYD